MDAILVFGLFVIFGGLVTCKSVCENRDSNKDYLGKEHNCGEGQCSCDGNTANCTGDTNERVLPLIDWNVTKLYVQCYNFSNLTRDTFKNIRHLPLQEIYLVQNFIYNISYDIFGDFNELTVIQIGENINFNLNKSALYAAFGSIQTKLPINLTIARAGIKHLNVNFFKYLKNCNVTSLSLPNNKIKYLYMDALNLLPLLKTLKISGNNVESKRGYISLPNLQELDLSRNKIHQKHLKFCYQDPIKRSDVPFFPNLKTLLLSHNYIRTEALRFSKIWHCLDNLEYLDLSNNTIESINISSFTRLKALKELSFASNWLTHVTPGKLPPNLTVLNFYDNHFTRFPQNLCKGLGNKTFPNVRVLNFGRNYVDKLKVQDDNCLCMPGIETLDFSRNDVSLIENGTFFNCRKLKTLYLNDMIPDTKVFQPAAFLSDSLINLYIRSNNINFKEHHHVYLFNFCPNLTRLDISYNVLEDMSLDSIAEMFTPLLKLEELTMQGLELQQFPNQLLQTLPKLKILNIDDNMLHTITIFANTSQSEKELEIQNISVADNFITTINERAFPSEISKSLRYLNLEDNQFLCDCQMEWFRDQVNSSGYIGSVQLTGWPDGYICRSPQTLEGHQFMDFQPDIDCEPLNPAIIVLISIGSFLVVFILVASTLYWNRWHIRYFFYKIGRRRQDGALDDPERRPIIEKIQFDGYVVSNVDDDEFVHHPFRELMENKLNYKLHIWKRNAKTGVFVDVVLDAIYASKQIVVVVSNNLLRDPWCKFQVDVAIDVCIKRQQNCLLLVVLEDVDFKPVSKSWCVLLTKKPTAYWSNDRDSNKYKLFEETVKQHFGKPINRQNITLN